MAGVPPQLIGESAEFHALLDWISDLASLNKAVLIIGERGTGKELVASRLHFLSPRWEKPYEYINCAAYPPEDLEWRLYNSEETPALLNRADGGTLFLDNVDALAPHAQERLVRVIEYGHFDADDGRGEQPVDVRFIASMYENPKDAVKSGQVSAEFVDRIAFDVVHLPPLRVRPDDIVPLTQHFGRKVVSSLGAESFPGLSPEALNRLAAHNWPGNVRELKNVIERSVARAYLTDETLATPIAEIILDPLRSPWEAPPAVQDERPETPSVQDEPSTPQTKEFSERVFVFERGLIDEAMTVASNHQGKAADYLGLTYHQFRGLLRKHGLKK